MRAPRIAACVTLALAASGCGAVGVIQPVAAAPAVLGVNSGGTSAGEPATQTTSSGAEPASITGPSAPSSSARLGVDRAIGQMLMSHVAGLVAPPRLLARIRAGQVGSVILYGENISSNHQVALLTASLQKAASEGGNPPLFIGTDQEGGPVKRLADAPPTMSAQEMGASSDPRALAEREGLATGRYLRRLGINLDFAPVSDIPTTTDNFLGERAFGYSTRSVVEGATGFAMGLSRAGIVGSAKHFPGLGAAGPHNTDLEIVSIAASERSLRASYAPYESMAKSGPLVAPMVMISNAIYPHLDPTDVPADLSRRIVHDELEAAHMGGRVAITDDLEVPAAEHYPNVPVRAVLAGDDILMFAQDEASSEHAYLMIRAAVRTGSIPSAVVLAAATRVDALKQTRVSG